MSNSIEDLENWYPIKVTSRNRELLVNWFFMPERFKEPFFFDTVRRLKQHDKNRYEVLTNLETFLNWAVRINDYINPTAFIFHTSRCGSTLISRMLSSLSKNIVLSEPELFDNIIRLDSVGDYNSHRKSELLNAACKYYGRKRFDEENNLVVKLDSWHILYYNIINSAYPDVPKLFLYRNPLEVFLSHNRQRGYQMVPGMIDHDKFPYDPFEWEVYELQKYSLFVLYNFLKAGLEAADNSFGNMLLLNYSELPQTVYNRFARHTGIKFNKEDIEQMQAVTGLHSKSTAEKYTGDMYLSDAKVEDEIMHIINEYLLPVYNDLEQRRINNRMPDNN